MESVSTPLTERKTAPRMFSREPLVAPETIVLTGKREG